MLGRGDALSAETVQSCYEAAKDVTDCMLYINMELAQSFSIVGPAPAVSPSVILVRNTNPQASSQTY